MAGLLGLLGLMLLGFGLDAASSDDESNDESNDADDSGADPVASKSDTDLGGHLPGITGDDSSFGEAGGDRLHGGEGDDHLLGGFGNNAIFGVGGDESIFGSAGPDPIFGQNGNDHLNGGSGDDCLDGGAQLDLIFGNANNDFLIGGDGDDGNDQPDAVFGEAGNDALVLDTGAHGSSGTGGDVFHGGRWVDPGDPAVIEEYTAGEDRLTIFHDSAATASVTVAESGGDALISLDGQAVMLVIGAAGMITADMVATVEQEL